jgi:hypothetical protein
MKSAVDQLAAIEASRTDHRFAVSRETIDTPEDLARWIDHVAQDDLDLAGVIFSSMRHFEPTDAELGKALRILAAVRDSR